MLKWPSRSLKERLVNEMVNNPVNVMNSGCNKVKPLEYPHDVRIRGTGSVQDAKSCISVIRREEVTKRISAVKY